MSKAAFGARLRMRSIALFSLIIMALSGFSTPEVQYTYDELGRLKTASYLDNGVTVYYQYDAAGNRTQVTRSGLTLPLAKVASSTRNFEGKKLYFAVWLNRAAEQTITVNYSVTPTNGASSADYSVQSGVDNSFNASAGTGTLTFNANTDGHSIIIDLNHDTDVEGDEGVIVRLESAVGAEVDPAKTEGIGTILDADGDGVVFSAKNVTAPEDIDGDAGTMTFSIVPVGEIKQPHKIKVKTADGSALAGQDYIPAIETLTFNPGDGAKTVPVQLISDAVYEANEYLTLEMELLELDAGATLDVASVQGTIDDRSDKPKVLISRGSLIEGDSGTRYITFSLWLDKATSETVSVAYCTYGYGNETDPTKNNYCSDGDGTTPTATHNTDYQPVYRNNNQRVTLSNNGTASIQIRIWPDNNDEGQDERFWVQLFDPINADLDDVKDRGVGTIREDDYTGRSVFNVNNMSVVEGQSRAFQVNRAGDTSKTHTVEYEIIPIAGGAIIGTDFQDPTPPTSSRGQLVFTPGTLQQHPSITTYDDTIYEGTEQFMIRIWAYEGNTTQGPGVPCGGSNATCSVSDDTGLGSITDDADMPSLSVYTSNPIVNEGDTVEFDVRLTKPASMDIELPYAPTQQGAASLDDYDVNSAYGTLLFKAGNVSPEEPIRFKTKRDTVPNESSQEYFYIRISRAPITGSDNDYTQVFGRIQNNTSTTHSASTVCSVADESEVNTCVTTLDTPATGTVSVVLDPTSGNDLIASLSPFYAMAMNGGQVTIDGEADLGTATPGQDYDASLATVTFNPGETTKVTLIGVVDDTINELDEEQLLLNGSTQDSSLVVNEPDPGIILDNDEGPIFSAEAVTAAEGNMAIVRVKKAGQTETSHSISWETVDGTAQAGTDYIPSSGHLVFGPTDLEKDIIINGVGDSDYELTETFTVTLGQPTQGAAIETPEVEITLTDNDPAPLFAINDATAIEGNDISFEVILNKASNVEHSVSYRTPDGITLQDVDFDGLSGTLTFAPGETSKTLTTRTLDDATKEEGAVFKLELYNPTNGAKLGDKHAKGTIGDNEPSPPPYIDPNTVFTIPAGQRISMKLAAGSGSGSGSGAGGKAHIEFTPTQTFYMRARVGRAGASGTGQIYPKADLNGGGSYVGGHGGGATSIIISSDGITWVPVAILGGGGSGFSNGHGGGLGLDADGSGFCSHNCIGLPAIGDTPGAGGDNYSYPGNQGGAGGVPGQDASPSSHYWAIPGQGDSLFGIGGGGPGGGSNNGGGGGGGRAGGGGGSVNGGGRGGSGYWDAASWQAIAGVTPTIISNETGGNKVQSGSTRAEGYVFFSTNDSQGTAAFDPISAEGSASDRPRANDLFFVPSGSNLHVTMAAGAGGSATNSVGGFGGQASFEVTTTKDMYVRMRAGRKGASYAMSYDSPQDITAGTSGGMRGRSGAQGGGASAIAISTDGTTWVPVAILGGGGGATDYPYVYNGQSGGGLNLAAPSNIAQNAQLDTAGQGAANNHGGDPGEAGLPGSDANNDWTGVGGQGDTLFGIGGGGAGVASTGNRNATLGGGGSGRYGGAGGYEGSGSGHAGGGSGYWDEAAWIEVAGAAPTILTNVTGGNAGEGFISFGSTLSDGTTAAFDPISSAPSSSLPTFTVSDVAVTEGDLAVFMVTRVGDTTGSISVDYLAKSDTATEGSDFAATSGTLTFAAGETSKLVEVQTLDQVAYAGIEGTETFHLVLSNPVGASLKQLYSTGTIEDVVEPAVQLVMNAPSAEEGHTLFFTATLDKPSELEHKVDLRAADDMAKVGDDFEGTELTLTFAPGETEKTFYVFTIDDAVYDSDREETLLIELTNPTNNLDVTSTDNTATLIDNEVWVTGGVTMSVSDAATVGAVLGNGGLTVLKGTMTGGANKESIKADTDPMTGGGIYYWEIQVGEDNSEIGLLGDVRINPSQRWDNQNYQLAMINGGGSFRGHYVPVSYNSMSPLSNGDVIGIYYNASASAAYLTRNGVNLDGWTEAELLAGTGSRRITGLTGKIVPIFATNYGGQINATYKFAPAMFTYPPTINYVPVGGLAHSTAANNIANGQLYDGEATLAGDFDKNQTVLIKAGSNITLDMAAGAGGAGRDYYPGGSGGSAQIQFTAQNDFYIRARIGKKGGSRKDWDDVLADITGGGVSSTGIHSGQGGGATSIIISSEGQNWTPVAVVGAGGGKGYHYNSSNSYAPGEGGGLGLDGTDGLVSGGKGAVGAQSGLGYIGSGRAGGSGGAPGQAGQAGSGTVRPGVAGQGDGEFLIGGGGGAGEYYAGGGGSGYAGGGGAVDYSPGGGGSGYWDAAAWQAIAGVTPTIVTNTTGGNAGNGYVIFNASGIGAAPSNAAVTPVFNVSDASAPEGQPVVFTVTMQPASDTTQTVSYVSFDQTAVAGYDYTPSDSQLTFLPGETSKTIVVDSVVDARPQGNRSFQIELTGASQGTDYGTFKAQGTITDTAYDAIFDTPGTHQWTAPTGVTSVSVVAIGGGGRGYATNYSSGGGGGGLGWKNNISVTPGQTYTVVVGDGGDFSANTQGQHSYFINTSTVAGYGAATSGGNFVGEGGGRGGQGGYANDYHWAKGGGGAGGYTGDGGRGGSYSNNQPTDGAGGAGSGGGYKAYTEGYGGGGTGLFGLGPNGIGAQNSPGKGGSFGSDASSDFNNATGGQYGGGGGHKHSTVYKGASGAVRIVWGPGLSYPSAATYQAADAQAQGGGQ